MALLNSTIVTGNLTVTSDTNIGGNITTDGFIFANKDHIELDEDAIDKTLTAEQKDILQTNTSKTYILLNGRRLDFVIQNEDYHYLYYTITNNTNELAIKINTLESAWTWELLTGESNYYYTSSGKRLFADYGGIMTTINTNMTSIAKANYIEEAIIPFTKLIRGAAFYGCTDLSTINAARCTNIDGNGFGACPKIMSAIFPECSNIGNAAFTVSWNAGNDALSIASFPKCKTIGANAFSYRAKLNQINFPICEIIGSSAFYYCSSLLSINFPNCTTIYEDAFRGCSTLQTATFAKCTTIQQKAFLNCSNLSTISFPKCTALYSGAFNSCINLKEVNFPECISLYNSSGTTDGGYAIFYGCTSLSKLHFQKLTGIRNSTFAYCGTSTTITISSTDFPVCKYIGYNAFERAGIKQAVFPACETLEGQAFYCCSNLSTISFPACKSMGYQVFAYCSNISVYFMGSVVPTVPGTSYYYSNGAFYNCTNYKIYVPKSMYAAYMANSEWVKIGSIYSI